MVDNAVDVSTVEPLRTAWLRCADALEAGEVEQGHSPSEAGDQALVDLLAMERTAHHELSQAVSALLGPLETEYDALYGHLCQGEDLGREPDPADLARLRELTGRLDQLRRLTHRRN